MVLRIRQKNNKAHILKKLKIPEDYQFLGLFALSIGARYYLPFAIGNLVFWLYLFIFMVSNHKKNHFWLVFFWLLFDCPGYLFSDMGVFR
jgi:hypothetical protein